MDIKTGAWPLVLGVLAAFGGLGGLGGLAAVLKSRSDGRKSDADAATAITTAATTLVAPLSGEVSRLTSRVAQLETDANVQRMLLVEHSVWDHLALARMNEAGVELPPIPPLFPERKPAAAEVHVEVRAHEA